MLCTCVYMSACACGRNTELCAGCVWYAKFGSSLLSGSVGFFRLFCTGADVYLTMVL
jgi:hypothetical protein